MSTAGCNIPGPVERYSYRVLADVSSLSVPDTSRYDNIRVSMSGVLGWTSGSSFEGVAYQRTDTLFEIVVYAREVYDSGFKYEAIEVRFDTTLALSVPKPANGKEYFFHLLGGNQILQDSSYVY
jgi:hypothetical protein